MDTLSLICTHCHSYVHTVTHICRHTVTLMYTLSSICTHCHSYVHTVIYMYTLSLICTHYHSYVHTVIHMYTLSLIYTHCHLYVCTYTPSIICTNQAHNVKRIHSWCTSVKVLTSCMTRHSFLFYFNCGCEYECGRSEPCHRSAGPALKAQCTMGYIESARTCVDFQSVSVDFWFRSTGYCFGGTQDRFQRCCSW